MKSPTISTAMNLGLLSEYMGDIATKRDAHTLLHRLLDLGYDGATIDEVPSAVWEELCHEILG